MPRDSQRSKLYRAEGVLAPFLGKPFASVEEMQSFVSRLGASAWYKRQFPLAPRRITVKRGRSGCRSTGGGATITMSPNHWNRHIVLHEVAHCIAGRYCGGWHGYRFARTLALLVRHEMGLDAYRALMVSYRACRVRHRKPRKVSPEQKAVLVARLRAAKEARS